MNYIVIILTTLLLTSTVKAQEPELVETFWYLNELILEGETIEVPPSNEDLPSVFLEFLSNSDGSYTLITCACFCYQGQAVFTPGFITLPDGVASLITKGCTIEENSVFSNLYALDFFYALLPEVKNPFAYEIITDADGNLQLTLTNFEGNTAVYGDVLLNVQDQEQTTFTIVPNPVDEVLQLSFSGNTLDAKITLYDTLGSEVYSHDAVTASTTSLNLAHLQSGLYFVQVVQGNQRSVQKFVKR